MALVRDSIPRRPWAVWRASVCRAGTLRLRSSATIGCWGRCQPLGNLSGLHTLGPGLNKEPINMWLLDLAVRGVAPHPAAKFAEGINPPCEAAGVLGR